MCEHLLGELRLAPLWPPGSPDSAFSGFLQHHLKSVSRPWQEGAGPLTAHQPRLIAYSPLQLV